jgi:hypothetical protein
MNRSITILFNKEDELEGIEIQAPTEEAQKKLEALATRIKRFLERPSFRVRLARLLLALTEMILLRMKFTPRRSLLLDRLITWAGK